MIFKMLKNKKSLLLLNVFIILLIGSSFAWWTWNSTTNTDISLTIDGIDVTYIGGDDIIGANLIPVASLVSGLEKDKAIEKKVTVSSTSPTAMNLYLTLENFPNALQDETLVWEMYNGTKLVGSGNFGSSVQGDVISLVTNQAIFTQDTTFKLYIWIDGTQPNPSSMMNQTFKFILSADASNQIQTAAERIISLSKGTTWNSGDSGVYNTIYQKEDGTTIGSDYRYIGDDVDNYVKFNNDMYQIIGVFDENTHGQPDKLLIKLIAANKLSSNGMGVVNSASSIENYLTYTNDWTGSKSETPANGNLLLNEYFLNNNTNSATYGDCKNWTYYINKDYYKTQSCQTIAGYGITDDFKKYIETVTWHLNGYDAVTLNTNDWYLCERGMYTGCNSASNGTYDAETNAKIGLMYVSDYMYASSYDGSNSQNNADSINIALKNWLYTGDEWTITPSTTSAKLFCIEYSGKVKLVYTVYGRSFRPTFYLKSDAKIVSGLGTFDEPYIIG